MNFGQRLKVKFAQLFGNNKALALALHVAAKQGLNDDVLALLESNAAVEECQRSYGSSHCC